MKLRNNGVVRRVLESIIADGHRLRNAAIRRRSDDARARRARPRRRAQLGMTLLEIMIVLAILAIVMGLLVGPAVMERYRAARIETTKLKLKKYAFEAYPTWATAHPDKACPDKLSDLDEYMNHEDDHDAWGQPLKMMCGADLPAGAKGLAVVSAGLDAKHATDDDLKSWDR